MKPFKRRDVTKRFAVKAAMYRRIARKMGAEKMDFSEGALLEMYRFESLGETTNGEGVAGYFSTLKARNGFAYGKWLRDLDVSQMVGDVRAGDFCKAEFLSTAIDRLHNTKPLSVVMAPTWFPFYKP